MILPSGLKKLFKMEKFCICILAVTLLSGQTFGFDCEASAVKACKFDSRKLSLSSTTIFPDIEFLKENCGAVESLIACFNAYNKTCGTLLAAFHPLDDLNELQDFVHEICTEDSHIHQSYAKHVTCLNENDKAIREIFEDEKMMNFIIKLHKDGHTLSRVNHAALHCIQISIWELKLEKVVDSLCGGEASDAISEIVSRISRPEKNLCTRNKKLLKDLTSLYRKFSSHP